MADPAIRLNIALKGRYRIERELGEGGMARKVRAIYDQSLKKWGLPVPPAAADARRTPAPTTRKVIAPLGKRKLQTGTAPPFVNRVVGRALRARKVIQQVQQFVANPDDLREEVEP